MSFQKDYFQMSTFDISSVAMTYSASSGAGYMTFGVMQYFRLDPPTPENQTLNFYMSVLFGVGSGTKPSYQLGLYSATSTKLTLIGSSATFGTQASGILRLALTMTSSAVELSSGTLYAGILPISEAGTNKSDIGRSATFATNYGYSNTINADQTGGGQMIRTCYGAGTGLSAVPASEAVSGVTAAGYLSWLALD